MDDGELAEPAARRQINVKKERCTFCSKVGHFHFFLQHRSCCTTRRVSRSSTDSTLKSSLKSCTRREQPFTELVAHKARKKRLYGFTWFRFSAQLRLAAEASSSSLSIATPKRCRRVCAGQRTLGNGSFKLDFNESLLRSQPFVVLICPSWSIVTHPQSKAHFRGIKPR